MRFSSVERRRAPLCFVDHIRRRRYSPERLRSGSREASVEKRNAEIKRRALNATGTCTAVSLECYRFICHRRKPHRGSGDYAANELAIFARKPERAWYGRTRDVYVIPLRYHLTDPPHYRPSGAVTYHR